MCIKNPKRFLIWKWYGDCETKVVKFWRPFKEYAQLRATFMCKLCGRVYDSYTSEETLVKTGVPVEEIILHRNELI